MAGGLIDLFGWRAAFLVPGAVSVATGLVFVLCLRKGWVAEGAADRRRYEPASRGDMLRAFTILLITMFCMGVIFQATQAALPKVFDLRLRDIAGEGAFGIGALVAFVYGVGAVMQVAGGRLADRYPLKPIYLAGFLIQVPVMVGLALFAGSPLIGMAVMAVILTSLPLPAENLMLARFTPHRHRSLAFGVKFVIAFGSAPLALQVVAQIKEHTGEFFWLFALLSVLAAVAAMAAFLLPATPRQEAAPAPAE
jgi:predicted MFS family arabinose efflux permease